MPGVERLSVDLAVEAAEEAAALGIPAIALFPYTDPALRDDEAREALNPDNLVCRAVRAIKRRRCPRSASSATWRSTPIPATAMTGSCVGGEIDNDETRRGAGHAGAGAGRGRLRHPRAVRHDGRPHRRDPRGARGETASRNTQILAYAAKYASAFYGPFRDAVGSSATLKGDKRTYQMDPANTDEALREVGARHRRGRRHGDGEAGLPYLDIVRRVKEAFERADLRLPGLGRVRDADGRGRARLARRRQGMLESLLAFKRAGADGILTYFAPRAAKTLRAMA